VKPNHASFKSVVNPSIFLCALLSVWALWANPATAQTDPLALQQQGIKRIEAYIDHYFKTGDRQSRLPELDLAATELSASKEEFVRRGEEAGAALSLVKLGDVRRLLRQTDWVSQF